MFLQIDLAYCIVIRFTSLRIDEVPSTCTHCREYICAFTSNYTGRGNPVRRHVASSREDQRTRRHSVLLHSLVVSDAYNATFGVATSKEEGTTAPPTRLWMRSSKHRRAVRQNLIIYSVIPIISKYRSVTLILKCHWSKPTESVQIGGYFRSEFYESKMRIQMYEVFYDIILKLY